MPEPNNSVHGSYGYSNEAGFLTNFSENEKEAIAVTRHRYIIGADYGNQIDNIKGSSRISSNGNECTPFAIPGIIDKWKNFSNMDVLDKVFFLNPVEYFNYIESKGLEYDKDLMNYSKRKYNYNKNKISWYLNATTSGYDHDRIYYVSDSSNNITSTAPSTRMGVVPALHIKPDYTFSNGKNHSTLNIGEKVEFGVYNNESIVWQVINITNDGHVLLITDKAIDIKPYSTKSDILYKNSKYINFDDYDIDIYDDLQISSISNNDITPPYPAIINDEELTKRQEGEFNVIVSFKDDWGIEYIELPDKNKIYNTNEVTFKVTENKNYLFRAKDNNGIFREFIVPIGNINLPSQVLIESTSNGWTNKNVDVNIKASNDVSYYIEDDIQNCRDFRYHNWANYNSYSNRRIRISGEIEFIKATKPVNNVSVGVGLFYKKLTKSNTGDYMISTQYIYPKRWNLSYLQEVGSESFDFIYTIPNDFYTDFTAFTQMNVEWSERAYEVRWKNLRYELLDNDGFGIDKIVLPNGAEIKESVYKDTLTEEGTYTYRVYDNNGRVTEKNITVLIDKKAPSIEFEYDNNTMISGNSILKVRAFDDRSGISKIVLPNGTETNKNTLDYNVSSNEQLTFKAYDNAGNVATKSINITNIDNEVTDVVIAKNPNDTASRTVEIVITSNDPAGINYIELPDGNRINSNTASYIATYNGEYRFLVCDGAGNKEYFYVDIENIDDTNPIVNIDKDSNWTNQGVQININTRD